MIPVWFFLYYELFECSNFVVCYSFRPRCVGKWSGLCESLCRRCPRQDPNPSTSSTHLLIKCVTCKWYSCVDSVMLCGLDADKASCFFEMRCTKKAWKLHYWAKQKNDKSTLCCLFYYLTSMVRQISKYKKKKKKKKKKIIGIYFTFLGGKQCCFFPWSEIRREPRKKKCSSCGSCLNNCRTKLNKAKLVPEMLISNKF